MRRGPRASLARECAYLWRVRVRSGGDRLCQVRAWDGRRCHGYIQAAHGFGVDEAPGVRYAPWNGIRACEAHHEFYERRKTLWHAFLADLWGEDVYGVRYALSKQTHKLDLAAIKRGLEAV